MPADPRQRPHHVFLGSVTGTLVAVVAFELMLRGLRLPQHVTALVLGVVLIPALVLAFARFVRTMSDGVDGVARAVAFAFANLALVIVFFAFLYGELGIVNTATRAEVTDFWSCLYFSASTITTAGLGDFVPTAEARFMAALEMMIGYVAFGIVTAAAFHLLTFRRRDDP